MSSVTIRHSLVVGRHLLQSEASHDHIISGCITGDSTCQAAVMFRPVNIKLLLLGVIVQPKVCQSDAFNQWGAWLNFLLLHFRSWRTLAAAGSSWQGSFQKSSFQQVFLYFVPFFPGRHGLTVDKRREPQRRPGRVQSWQDTSHDSLTASDCDWTH